MNKKAFSLTELIFVIVIVGILAAMAVPKFRGVTQNAKVSSELATASTIQSALEDIHSDWIISDEGSFSWGNGKSEKELNQEGYPKQLGECPDRPFSWILKNSSTLDAKWSCQQKGAIFIYRGPASSLASGVAQNGSGKPDKNDCWLYNPKDGTFELQEDCKL